MPTTGPGSNEKGQFKILEILSCPFAIEGQGFEPYKFIVLK